MRKLLYQGILSSAYGEDVSFKVIHAAGSDTGMAVQIQNDDNIYKLERSELDPLLHTGTAPSSKPYRYIVVHSNGTVLDQESQFRQPVSTTLHEFYGRTRTIFDQANDQPLPLFGNPIDRLDSLTAHPAYEIPTIHIRAPVDDLRELYENYLEDFAIKANMSHITATDFRQFEDVKFELSGQTSRLFEKFSFNFHLDKEKDLGGYRKFKLRACATDPSFMREKLYYDVLEAAGLPASRASYVRLFINNEPHGLYVLVDNYKNPFLKNMFGKGEKKYKHGMLVQGSLPENPMAPEGLKQGANLEYRGSEPDDYKVGSASLYKLQQEASKGDIGLENFFEFLKFINEQGAAAGKVEWERRFNVDMFLKNMALEVLMGHVDGYLGAAHNYFLYQDPATEQFVWMSADLDQTMGNTMVPLTNNTSLDRFGLLEHENNRPLIRQIMLVPEFKARYEQILQIIHGSLYANSALLRRSQFLADMIREDVAWDATLTRLRSSKNVAQNHREQLQQKILQLPLGPDFLSRIGAIDFDTALQGPITDHPSIMPLQDWLAQTSQALSQFIARM